MKKLFKQYRELESSINESKEAISNMEDWDNVDAYDRRQIEKEKEVLHTLSGKMILLLQKITEESAKELKQREYEYATSLQSA